MGGTGGIPGDVERLINRSISSVEQLELLLLLRGEQGRSWTPEQAARTLHTATNSATIRLGELVTAKLAARDGDGFRYAATPAADAVVADLERYYGTHRTRVIGMIFDKPPGPVRAFADAFRLRKSD